MVDPEQLLRRLHPLQMKGGLVLSLSVTFQYLGQWDVFGFVFVASVVRFTANGLLARFGVQRWGPSVTEWIRLGVNAGTLVAIGLWAGWSLLLWIYVPFILLWLHGLDRWGWVRAVLLMAVMDGAALWSGCDPYQPLAFSIIGVLGFLLSAKRAELLQQTLEEVIARREQLARAQDQLRVMHERALQQEKLSSLGMMAAGVAHEINNPMAFVTSNVSSLYKELQLQPVLAEPLKEYVDEVLPETLDGIKRVNAIVSDLRHFARGDPEIPAEYDLNAEAQTALRLAHRELSHCEVQVALGEVGTVVGRPRQIGQALLNLLVNAGQATPPGGTVRLSTRREGEEVRVEIRDTGTGMSPETRRRLFEPFFTTKPPGKGMGLGLAVAHGIVTAQGGHIEVESELGKGSCFTLRLPRVAFSASASLREERGQRGASA
ncbi:hypothetical protein DB31_7940 [Hyalangium minutum]|uniref:histidine kinase n=1 Tax=Hyalangium minutum TaxID=394096 RepID=A0A085WLZ0_9BACT|nr:hypothetical protein DB31_7940 [Hyalangium minutum]